MVAWYCLVFASIVWFRLPLWKVKTDCWFQSCKALKIDSFAKNHKNNDGHGGLLKDMIVNPEVVLQFAYIWYIKKRWQRWWLVVLNHGKIQWSYNTAARRSCSSLQLYLFTMDIGQIDLLLYLCFNWQLYFESSFTHAVEIFCALHRLLVNYFADLTIHKAESTQLVFDSGQRLLVCNLWYWV